MVNRIGLREAEAAYIQALKIRREGLSEADARSALVTGFGINNATASDMLRNFAQLLKGKCIIVPLVY